MRRRRETLFHKPFFFFGECSVKWPRTNKIPLLNDISLSLFVHNPRCFLFRVYSIYWTLLNSLQAAIWFSISFIFYLLEILKKRRISIKRKHLKVYVLLVISNASLVDISVESFWDSIHIESSRMLWKMHKYQYIDFIGWS